jgi:1-acyl-sn-glycerol-3-phosphate acyltransferase
VKKFSQTFWSVWSWLVFGICIALWLPLMAVVWLVTAPFDPSRYWTGYLFRKLTVVHQRLNPLWTFRVGGTMPANPRNPYVVVSNHESFVDILLISHLPWEMKWLSKKENFKIPVAGWLMRMARDIELDRKDPKSAVAAMQQCRQRLDDNVSVMIFPEGTRSTTGDLLPFKDGAFRLAIEAQVPILPLAVHGAATALKAHDWRQGRSTAEVRVLEPVSTEGMTLDDVASLKQQVRERIVAELVAMGRSFEPADSEESADEVGTILLTETRDVEAAGLQTGLVGVERPDAIHVGNDVAAGVDHRTESA